ncbi:hypothetical protein BCR39DRAFT_558794 [Naematelia encephala]|uniref:Uncharacterized protein n=1 Tax=Naematelia encephala TaxID=71784 RepID=A0A1Y2B560_9TREE|nr:hypothetical protein BCR39DRAFT_558794 [Naematelia encephala]
MPSRPSTSGHPDTQGSTNATRPLNLRIPNAGDATTFNRRSPLSDLPITPGPESTEPESTGPEAPGTSQSSAVDSPESLSINVGQTFRSSAPSPSPFSTLHPHPQSHLQPSTPLSPEHSVTQSGDATDGIDRTRDQVQVQNDHNMRHEDDEDKENVW